MKLLHTLTGLLIIAGLLLANSGCSQPSAAELTNAAPSSPVASVDRVTAAKPERKALKLYTSQPGRIEAFEETPLYSKISGYVEEVTKDIGDVVEKGQVLIKLWIPEMQDEERQKQALVDQGAAEVKQAEQAVQVAEAAVETAEAKVAHAEAGIGRAEGEFERWKAEHSRIRELAAKGAITQKLVEETLNQFRAADAAQKEAAAHMQSAKAAANEARVSIQKSKADLVVAQARHDVAQANLQWTRTLLGYTEIKAPFDGVVTRRSVDTGHYVYPANSESTKPLIVVARTDKVRVFVDVPEMEAPLVDGGDHSDSAVVRVQALGGREFDAQVTRTSWSLDSSNRSLRTEIDVPNEGGLLRPGMYATATILLEQRTDALALPISAIVHDGREVYCYCVVSGKVDRRPIELGLRSGEEVEVVTGLDGSQTVVLARVEDLTQGQAVEIIAPEE